MLLQINTKERIRLLKAHLPYFLAKPMGGVVADRALQSLFVTGCST